MKGLRPAGAENRDAFTTLPLVDPDDVESALPTPMPWSRPAARLVVPIAFLAALALGVCVSTRQWRAASANIVGTNVKVSASGWGVLSADNLKCRDTKNCLQDGNNYCDQDTAKTRCADDSECTGIFDISMKFDRWKFCTSKETETLDENGHGVMFFTRDTPPAGGDGAGGDGASGDGAGGDGAGGDGAGGAGASGDGAAETTAAPTDAEAEETTAAPTDAEAAETTAAPTEAEAEETTAAPKPASLPAVTWIESGGCGTGDPKAIFVKKSSEEEPLATDKNKCLEKCVQRAKKAGWLVLGRGACCRWFDLGKTQATGNGCVVYDKPENTFTSPLFESAMLAGE